MPHAACRDAYEAANALSSVQWSRDCFAGVLGYPLRKGFVERRHAAVLRDDFAALRASRLQIAAYVFSALHVHQLRGVGRFFRLHTILFVLLLVPKDYANALSAPEATLQIILTSLIMVAMSLVIIWEELQNNAIFKQKRTSES